MFDDNPQVQQPAPEQPQPAQAEQPQTAEQPQQQPAPKPPAAQTVKTTQEERMWAAIGYIAFLGVVTLAMVPKSEFCKKHASQGIVLFVLWFIGLIVLALPITLVSGIGGLVLLAVTVVAIIGIVKAISSYEFKLPILSDLAKMIPTGAIVGSLTGKTPPPPAATPTQPVVSPEEQSVETPKPAEPVVEKPEEKPEEPQVPAETATPEAPTAPSDEEAPKQ